MSRAGQASAARGAGCVTPFVLPLTICTLTPRATLNLCMPYASRDEIAFAIRNSVSASLEEQDRQRGPDAALGREITPDALASRLMLADSPPLDVLIRTSGVSRLSDFMLWQTVGGDAEKKVGSASSQSAEAEDDWLRTQLREKDSGAQLHFTDCYWPEFGWRQLAPIILDWQRRQMASGAKEWLQNAADPQRDET